LLELRPDPPPADAAGIGRAAGGLVAASVLARLGDELFRSR